MEDRFPSLDELVGLTQQSPHSFSDSPEPTIESAAPPTPPDETNEQRARRLAKKHGVDPKLVVSMMAQESQGKTKARS